MSNLEDRRFSPRRPIGPQTGPDWVLIALDWVSIALAAAILAILATIPENGGVP